MAKQKTLFSKIVRKVKQDASRVWTKRKINAFDILNQPIKSIPEDALALQGEGFIHTLQLEALLRSFDEEVCVEDDSEPFIYPGLMAAWESMPVTVELDSAAVEFARHHRPEVLHTPLEQVRSLFPGCLLCDIRSFGLRLYDLDCDGVFIYPGYDLDRGYSLLLVLAVSLKKGLTFPLESKIVLKGNTFFDALEITTRENRILEERCWSGLDKCGHEVIFSPIEDEPEVGDLAALVLALMCGSYAKVEVLPGSQERRLRVSLVEDAVAAADAAVAEDVAEAEGNVEDVLDALVSDDTADAAEASHKSEPEDCIASFPAFDDADAAEDATGEASEAEEESASPAVGAFVDAAEYAHVEAEALDYGATALIVDTSQGDEAGAAAHDPATEVPPADDASSDAQDDIPSPADGEADSLVLISELQAQVASLEAALADQERKSSSLEYHLGQAQAAANQAKSEAAALRKRAELAESMDIPLTPLEALELAERAFGDRLIFIDQARRSAEEFAPKGTAREVWAVLRSMAVVLHPLIFGKASGNIIHAFEAQSGFELTFREMKMIKAADTYSKLRHVTYQGEQKDIAAHVKGKGTKKGESLRVHFFADYNLKKIVIAHCGEHLQTYDTSSL